jgi:uncharacterized membrane protein
MSSEDPEQPPTAATEPKGELSPGTRENLELLSRFQDREEAQISGVQATIEGISKFFGSPAYFAFVIGFIAVWVLLNLWGRHAGWQHVDDPPFFVLQALVSSNALLLTVAVLIRQNRMAQMADHRSHLDLQINLLTEQKVTKALQIIAELHRELTALRPRPDAEVEEMSKPADAHALMHAIKKTRSE